MSCVPLVSILLPVYNLERYIGEAIESALNQTEENFELLIADNASTDGTFKIIEKFSDPRIQLFRHERNLGAARNWDFLLQKAKGKYACVLGADDRFLPNHLERKIALLEADSGIGIAHGATRVIDCSGSLIDIHRYGSRANGVNTIFLADLLVGNPMQIGVLVFRMDTVRNHHLHFDANYSLFCDWRLWIDILFNTERCVFDDVPTGEYRVHDQSHTSQTRHTLTWALQALEVAYDALIQYEAKWCECEINPLKERLFILTRLLRVSLAKLLNGKFHDSFRCLRLFGKMLQV